MAQLNVYVPDEIERQVKEAARREGCSISAFVLESVRRRIAPPGWSMEFLETFGGAPDFGEIPDPPAPQRPTLLDEDEESGRT